MAERCIECVSEGRLGHDRSFVSPDQETAAIKRCICGGSGTKPGPRAPLVISQRRWLQKRVVEEAMKAFRANARNTETKRACRRLDEFEKEYGTEKTG